MRRLLVAITVFLSLATAFSAQPEPLNYGRMVLLDAEDLAEMGVREGYERVVPSLEALIGNPAVEVSELIDTATPRYVVRADGIQYEVFTSGTSQERSWGNATYALFRIVNAQLAKAPRRFYAINAGNELGGLFLTRRQYRAMIASLEKKTDWPYIPTPEFRRR